jgi:hypothetical protein
MGLMLWATRSAHIVGRVSQKEKHHEKQDDQDSVLNGDVARNGLGLSTGRYLACPALLSHVMPHKVTT